MFQILLILLLLLIIMLFLFSLKIYFMLDGFSHKLMEIDARLLKMEKEYFELKAKVDHLDASFKMTMQKLNSLFRSDR
ncbi:hypothetical protein [Desulfurobacterium sp.]